MSENNEKTITIKESEISALLAQNRELMAAIQLRDSQNATEEPAKKRTAVRDRSVTIMFVDGKPVIGMRNVGTELNPVHLYETPDPRDSKKVVLCADLIIKDLGTDKEEVIKGVNFREFIDEGERRDCRVLKTQSKNWVIEQGSVLKKEVKEYRTVELDAEVPLEVTGVERHYEVEIDGKSVVIFEAYVNMAKSTPRPQKSYFDKVEE